MMTGLPMARYFFASLNALGAVDVIEEIPMMSASLSAFQSGSEMSSINVLEL
jgi:hypothetical protein